MKESYKKGLGFGITSGIITTLGLIIGLYAGEASKLIIVGGIITIAIADAFSDALGIHISEETKKSNTPKQIWESTFSTFLFKFIFAIIFIIPFLFFDIQFSVIVSTVFGLFLLSIFSYKLAEQNKRNSLYVILEHLLIAVIVIIIVYFIGKLVIYFGLV